MKKQLIYSTLIAATILAGTTGFILNDTTNANSHTDTESLIATNTSLATTPVINNSKDETVYLMSNADGSVKQTFVGNTIYNGDAELPFDYTVKYYLEDEEISATDLSGKSGHVKIVYSLNSTATYLGRKVPFLAITGVTLDNTKFSNIEISNGKLIEQNSTLIAVGYTLPGVNENLGTDFMPENFIIEADTTNFTLGTTYTILTNSVIADLDTSRLSDLDSLVGSINQLSNGLNQIISGSTDLKNGLDTLLAKSKTLASGVEELSNGLAELTTYNDALNGGASAIFSSILETTNTSISTIAGTEINLTADTYSDTLDYLIYVSSADPVKSATLTAVKAKLASIESFCTNLQAYTDGVADAAAGAAALADNMPALINGETELYTGATQLSDGLNTFKATGIDKLTSFANNDLASFTDNARMTVSAARNYKHFASENATSVKFIIKTASI